MRRIIVTEVSDDGGRNWQRMPIERQEDVWLEEAAPPPSRWRYVWHGLRDPWRQRRWGLYLRCCWSVGYVAGVILTLTWPVWVGILVHLALQRWVF